jgi:uncharacterized membrane protein YfcA
MGLADALFILLAGVCAGAINTMVGSGTLITFPALLAIGYSPVVANVSNNIGLVPGSVSGTISYRAELAGQRWRAKRPTVAALLGGCTGAGLLLVLPSAAFRAIVPVFIIVALVLIVFKPRLSAAVNRRRRQSHPHGGRMTLAAVGIAGIYGGYFGAAQGILLLAVLGLGIDEHLHRINALKNLLTLAVNAVAALVFIAFGDVAWNAVALIALGSATGGQIGGRIGRRLPEPLLRSVIVVVGGCAVAKLLIG